MAEGHTEQPAGDKMHARPVNILTVDVEDWFHICGVQQHLPRTRWHQLESRVAGNTLSLLSLLESAGAIATFFVLGWVAERFPDLVRSIASRGHEIASHGYFHRRVYTMEPEHFERDVERSLTILSSLSGRPITGYRAPEWSIRDDSLWALPILARLGIRYDASMAALPVIGHPENPKGIYRHDRCRGRLWEVPPLVASTPFVNLPVGGGWGLRTFPYALVRHAIRAHNRAHGPAVLFIHPCELDADRPKIDTLPLSKRFVVNAGWCCTAQRLRRLLQDYRFTSISAYLQSNTDCNKKVESSRATN